MKLELISIPKNRKRVLMGPGGIRVRDLLRQTALHPTQIISKIVPWLKGISSRMLLPEFLHLKKQFRGKYLWARGYLAVSLGNITSEMIRQYIEEQEGEPVVDDSRFQIDPS